MTADQVVNEITKWVKRALSLALLLIVSAMLVESATRLLGIPINLRAPGWDQGTALTIAALAYALGRS